MGEFEIEVFIEAEEAGFSLVREFDIGDEINCDNRMHMLDSCSRFGNVFVGRKFGFDLFKVTELEAKKEAPKAVVKVNTKGQLQWLAVSSCGLTLLVSTITDGKTENIFYDVRSLMKGSNGYFAKQSPATSPSNGALLSAAWNPSISELITMVYSSGAVEVLKVEDAVSVHSSRPPMNAKCVAWSPKGKQMVLGFGDGTLAQFTPTMEIKKKVNACPLINGNAKVTDIVWISTYKFGVAYADDASDAGANLFTVHLPEKGEKRDPIWRCFEDPTFAAAAKRDSQMYLPLIVPWGMFAVTNSNSGDCALMGTKNTEVQVWSLADEARAELPLNEDSDETSCVIGACWNMNFKDPLQILSKQQNAPCLWVLSNSGVLVAFRLYNFLPNFPDQKQLTDSIPGGDRKTLAVEEAVPPARVSLPLQRTSSVAQPNLTNKSAFGNNTTLFAPPLSSTPAMAKIEQKTKPSPRGFSIVKEQPSSATISETPSTFGIPKPAPKKQVEPAAASVVPKPSVMPTPKEPSSVFTQEDLASLVNDFEREMDLYKLENAKTDLSFFNEDAKKELKTKTDELKKFASIAKRNSEETIDEVQHVKLRSLEGFASYEAAHEASKKRTFKEENKYCKSVSLCPLLAKQVESIRTMKRYLNNSVYEVTQMLDEKVTENKENTSSMSDFYKCIETNERLVHYHSRKMQQLSAQLNKVRLSRRSAVTPRGSPMKQSFVEQLSNESCGQEKLVSSPRSQMRPEHVQKLKSQLSGRKSIPVRSKAKVDTSTIIVNKKPQAVIEKSSFNRAEQEPIPKLQLEPESAPSTPDIRIQRDASANVVSYMPAKPKTPQSFPTSSGPPNVEAPKTSFFGSFGGQGGENESKYNLNNPPQVINASTLPQAKGPSFAGAFSPAPHVNKGTQDAVRAALNTVNKIASEPSSVSSKLPEKEKTPHVSAFSVPQKAPGEKLKPTLGGIFTPPRTSEKKAEKTIEEPPKANIFAAAKEPAPATTSKPNLFAPKTSSTAPANVNPFASTPANVFGSSKPDTSKSTFTFRNVVVSSSSEKDVSDAESGHISETDDESADDLEETIKVASTETVPKPNLFGSAPKSGTGLFGSTATDSKAASSKPSIFGATTPKGPFGALSKAGGVGASGDRFTLDESAYDTPPRRPSKAKSPNVSGVNLFAGIQKEDAKADEKSTADKEATEKAATSKPPSGLATAAKTEEKKPTGSLFGSTPSKPAEDKDEEKETAAPSTEKPTIKNLFGTPAKQDEKPKPGLFGSSTSSGLFGSKTDDSKPKETSSAAGLFGSKPAEASSGSSLFGSKTEETKPTQFGSKEETSSSSGLFGSKPAESSSGTGLFGSTKKPEGSLFGTPKPAEKTESGLFGSSKPAETSSGSGLFGSSKPESSGGLFGSKPSESSNVFGTPAKSESNSGGGLFGSKPAESSGGLFGSSTPQSASGFGNSGGGGGLFGSSNTTSNSGGLFGSSNSNTSSSGGLFGSSNNDNNSGGGVFGSSGGFSGLGAKPDPEKAKQNPFGSSSFGNNSSSTNNSNLFGNTPANPFGSSTSNQQSSSGPFSGGGGATSPFSGSGGGSSGGFGSSAFGSSGNSGGSAFGSGAFSGGASSPFGSSAFGSSNQQSNSFGSGNNSGGVFGGGSGGSSGFGSFGGNNSGGGFGAKASGGGGGFGSFGGGNNQQQNNSFSGSGFSGFR